MPRKKTINLDVILSRKIKGYAFMTYPQDGCASAEEYREKAREALLKDWKELSEEAFRQKYSYLIY